jgi:pyruvate/2-oxoglutarate dehydrogenase complex dihydrolipoamide acyltransferase (E2) component
MRSHQAVAGGWFLCLIAGLLKDVRVSVPPIGKDITKAKVATFHYGINQHIQAGEVVATLETPEMNIEVAGPVSGKIVQVLAGKGDSVEIGDELFVITEEEHTSNRRLVYSDFTSQRINNVYEPLSLVVQRASEWANGRHLVSVETLILPGEQTQTIRAWAFEQ